MSRWNAEGIPVSDLHWVLRREDLVRARRRVGKCFVCCESNINEAGLCEVCLSLLSDDLVRMVEKWRQGMVPL